MISIEKKIKILLIAGIVGCLFFIWYKVAFAAWQELAQASSLENKETFLHRQSAP